MLRARPAPTSAASCGVADVTAAMTRRGAARHRPRLRRRPRRRLRPHPGQARQRGQPARAAGRLGHRRQPPRRRPPRAGRLLAALHAAGARRGPRHASTTPERVAEHELVVGHRQPDGAARRPGRVVRQLPRRAARLRVRLPRHRRSPTSARIAERRTDRLLDRTRSHGLPPFLADDAGRQLRADDRPLHAGGDGGREPPAGRPGQRRHASPPARCRRTTCRWGGARPASCAGRRQPGADPGRRAGVRGPRRSISGPRSRPPPAPARRWPRCARVVAGPGPDRWLAPELAAAEALVADGALARPPSSRHRARCA